jgi:hypothetical protein
LNLPNIKIPHISIPHVNIPHKAFVLGLIVTVIISCVASVGASMLVTRGTQGPKGDTGPQGTQGIQGAQGTSGTNGVNGTKWFSGTSTPSNTIGANGDFYLNSATGDIYTKNDTAWNLAGNLAGALSGIEQLTFITAYASDTPITYMNVTCYAGYLTLKNTGSVSVTVNNIFLNGQPYNSTVSTSLVPGGTRAYQQGIASVSLQPNQSLGARSSFPSDPSGAKEPLSRSQLKQPPADTSHTQFPFQF